MKEDYLTYAQRKILISIARSQIGAHYLKGGLGRIPGSEGLELLPNKDETVMLNGNPLEWGNYFAAKNSLKTCSGKHGKDAIEKRPKGDGHKPAHLADPEKYKWQRVVKFKHTNPVWGESCVGKAHFDCIDFVRWCLRKINPCFMWKMELKGTKSIAGLKGLIDPVGNGTLNKDDLCAGDILIRNKNGHIGFATGDGQRVVQAEWEASGVVETSLGEWEFHGRIPRGYWLFLPPDDEK